MTTPDSLVETLAAQWDGCEYDAPGGLIDIGDAIRRAGLPLAASQAGAQAGVQARAVLNTSKPCELMRT